MNHKSIAVALGACLVCFASSAFACHSDDDCTSDLVCVGGECTTSNSDKTNHAQPASTAPAPSSGAATTGQGDDTKAAAPSQPAPRTGPHMGLYTNALGLVEFGPSVSFEFGSKFAGLLRVRSLNLGPFSYVKAAATEDKFKFGYGVGAGFRVYLGQANLRGFYAGGGLEFIDFESQENDGRHDKVKMTYVSQFVMPYAELGYRWIFGERFVFGVGGGIGYLVVTKSDTKYEVQPDTSDTAEHLAAIGYKNTASNQIFGEANVEVGFLF